MNYYFYNIKHLLCKVINLTLTENELCQLVQKTRNIVEAHLLHIRSSITRLCLTHGLTITDLAYDCIAEAFVKDENNQFICLHNFVESLREEINTLPDNEVFLAYKSFIIKIANTQLARLYAQIDPAGAKIHRNLRDCLKHSAKLKLINDYRGYMI